MKYLPRLLAVFLGLLMFGLTLPCRADTDGTHCELQNVDIDLRLVADGFLGSDRAVCTGDSVVLQAPLALSYLWSTGETSRIIRFKATATNEYWARITNLQGTVQSDTVKVTVNPRPNVVVQPSSTTLLPGEAVLLNASGALTYLWPDGSTNAHFFVSPILPENIYTVIGTNAFGCSAQAQAVVHVNYTTIPSFTATKTCIGDSTFFETRITTNDVIQKIEWDLDGDLEYDDAVGSRVSHLFKQAGEWLVGIKVTTLYGAEPHTVYLPVKVGDIPQLDFEYSNNCLQQAVAFEGKASMAVGEIESWNWNFGNGATSNQQNPTATFDQAKTYPVVLNVVSTTGCQVKASKPVAIQQKPQLTITFSDGTPIEHLPLTLYKNETIHLKANGLFDYVIWNGTIRNEYFNVTREGIYTAVSYRNSCISNPVRVSALQSEFPYDPSLTISNILTPNGDGYNDTWEIPMLNSLKPVKVTIYTRSGLQVYYSNDYQNDWKGQHNNNPLPEGSYFYIVEGSGGELFKGSITLLR